MKLVKFKDGKYGIRRRNVPFFWVFEYQTTNRNENYWWWTGANCDGWQQFAKFDTLDAAREKLSLIQNARKRDWGAPITPEPPHAG